MTYAETKALEALDGLALAEDDQGGELLMPPGGPEEILRALRDAGLRIVEDR